jgi:hypothetical protein
VIAPLKSGLATDMSDFSVLHINLFCEFTHYCDLVLLFLVIYDSGN